MKQMKNLMAMLLAVSVLLACCVCVSAAEPDLSGHKYIAYQIFAGTQSPGDPRLAEVEWGTGINGAAFLDALKSTTAFSGAFAGCATAKQVAAVLAQWGDDSENAYTFAKFAYAYRTGVSSGTTDLPAGYYLIVDATKLDDGATDTAYNLALLQLTQKGDLDIRTKVAIPTVQKKVKDTNDTNNTTTEWQDSADFDIGDVIDFQLTATLADFSRFDAYRLVFHDSLCKGLTYMNNAVVRLGNVVVTSSFDISHDPATNTLTVVCNNVKTLPNIGNGDGQKITVEYRAALNKDAEIGAAGNPNEVYLEYSNNPNESALVNGSTAGHPTGNTKTDTVRVFTYQVVVNKVDEHDQPLEGASFELFKKGADGAYASLGQLTGKAIKDAQDNITSYEYRWVGIDDGEYKISETAAPAGYNKVDDMVFTVAATHDADSPTPALTALSAGDKLSGSVDTGTISATIKNEPGVTIPETGSRGTTIFYVVGTILMLGAVVVLVSKKRMTLEND